MKKTLCALVALALSLSCIGALALPQDDLPSHELPFEQLVGDNGDYDTLPGDWPKAGTYRAVVDVVNQVVTVYESASGKIVRQSLCSTGTKADPTPLGTFKMPEFQRFRFRYFRPKTKNTFGQYMTKINDAAWFHSVIYSKQDANTYTTTSYNNLGKRASHGCIRLPVPDARWIYFNLAPGTKVEIRGDMPVDKELVKSLALPKLPKKRPTGLENVPQIFAQPQSTATATATDIVIPTEARLF